MRQTLSWVRDVIPPVMAVCIRHALITPAGILRQEFGLTHEHRENDDGNRDCSAAWIVGVHL